MPMSDAQKRAQAKYKKANYKYIQLRIRTDSPITKEDIENHAEKNGESLNGYILRLIREDIGKQ